MMTQILAAAVGTFAFAVLFGVPRAYYFFCGVIGGCGWIVYLVFEDYGAVTASLIATMGIVLLSRLFAIKERCPVTIFLISGIFPLVPGSYVYWTTYYFVTNQPDLALEKGYMALKIAFAMVLGIVFVFEIPQSVFVRLLGEKKKCDKNKKSAL